jgi:ribosomal protein L37AE/L43A
MKKQCHECAAHVPAARWALGYRICLNCGEAAATAARKGWTVAPMHKSNYMLLTNRADLLGLNPKQPR